MQEQEKIRIRQFVEQFQPLTDAAWKDLSDLFSYRELKKGAPFVTEGAYNDQLAFIIDGALRAYYLDAKGDFYNKTFFIANTFAASLASILQGIPSFLSFDALVDTQLWQASYTEMSKLFDQHHCIERMVRKIIEYEWVIKKEQRELRLVLTDAAARYAYFQEEYPGLESKIPQYHIASHLGITPIQLSRIRAQRKAEGSTK